MYYTDTQIVPAMDKHGFIFAFVQQVVTLEA